MKLTTFLFLLAPTTILSLTCITDSSDADIIYCCVGGDFSGPVYSSFESSLSSEEASLSSSLASISASISGLGSAIQSSINSEFASLTAREAMPHVTEKAVLEKRGVQNFVAASGLTCVGSTLLAESGGSTSTITATTIAAASGQSFSLFVVRRRANVVYRFFWKRCRYGDCCPSLGVWCWGSCNGVWRYVRNMRESTTRKSQFWIRDSRVEGWLGFYLYGEF